MRILYVHYVWPEPNSSAAGRRNYNLLSWLDGAGHSILNVSPSAENMAFADLKGKGFLVEKTEANSALFDRQLAVWQPDVVVFDRFICEEQFGWRVQKKSPNAVRIIDTQDLHFIRNLRQEVIKAGGDIDSCAQLNCSLQTKMAVREISSIFRADLSLILSDFEMQVLQREFNVPKKILSLIPLAYPKRNSIDNREFQERKNICFIGNFRHPPNYDAFLYLQKLWPAIQQQLPGSEIHIMGAYPDKKAMAVKIPGMVLLGHVTDLSVLANYRICLAPLRFGAGLKGKILDCWQKGTPVVTTSIGSEGLVREDLFGGYITNNEKELLAKTVKLYSDREEWDSKQKEGYRLIDSYFVDSVVGPQFLTALQTAHLNLAKLRQSNFVGQMLNYHKNQSLRYLSKWIEAKNLPYNDERESAPFN